jgi:hypothetical protein
MIEKYRKILLNCGKIEKKGFSVDKYHLECYNIYVCVKKCENGVKKREKHTKLQRFA